MVLRQIGTTSVVLTWLLASATPEPGPVDNAFLTNIANVSYASENSKLSSLASIFSPRMDFEQWKPLTGRGDPLRNDPTYDYEPPVLERVHYWAEETRLEREHFPERKSEVLMLGVSSRKPSVAPRQPPTPPRRHHRPPPQKYEDYSYKLSDHYPMTILVPPPLPPPGQKPSLFILSEDKLPEPTSHIKLPELPKVDRYTTTGAPEHLTSLYTLQEANLIYQSSTTSQNWLHDVNDTKPQQKNAVSSDYAGWGPTTPIDEYDMPNDTHNLIISNDHIQLSKQPYSFYRPMLSEAPPPPRMTPSPLLLPTFFPTALPPLPPTAQTTTPGSTQATWPTEQTTTEFYTAYQDYNEETTTEKNLIKFPSTPSYSSKQRPVTNIFDMMSPMITMPLINGPERPEDNLYAHASESVHVYRKQQSEDTIKLETMQTMLPPPLTKFTESTTSSQKQPFHENSNTHNSFQHKKPSLHTHDPYLHMRFTTPIPTTASSVNSIEHTRTTETPTVPMYLIIQGHSKVKTYGSKPKFADDSDTINNEIPKPNETSEVKHLHPIKDKYIKKPDKVDIIRRSRAQNLKSLVDEGHGSIEIQETDVGIKYDVSDGSEVPVEIYRKGIVDNDENDYVTSKKRVKRQIDLEDLLPFDEDTLEEYVYNFLKGRRNATGITGLIAQAVTGNAAAVIEELDDDGDEEQDHEDR